LSIRMLVNSKYNGARVPAGEVVDYGEEINKQLITEGSAEAVTGGAEDAVGATPTDTIQGGKNSEDGKSTAEEQEAAAVAAAEAVALVRKALESQYKKDELVEAAFKVGVEFPTEATKAVIIEAAVAQGKAEALLK